MIRTFAAITAASITLAAPAVADQVAVKSAVLSQTAASMEARQHLVRQGYVNISNLEQDAAGRWSGTAQKNGKTVIVAISLNRPAPTATN